MRRAIIFLIAISFFFLPDVLPHNMTKHSGNRLIPQFYFVFCK